MNINGMNMSIFNEWRARVDARLLALETSTDAVQAGMTRIEASMPSRADIEQAARTRVDVSTWNVAHQALIDRVSRLESGPQRLIPWISASIGCAALLISGAGLLIMVASVIVTIVLRG